MNLELIQEENWASAGKKDIENFMREKELLNKDVMAAG